MKAVVGRAVGTYLDVFLGLVVTTGLVHTSASTLEIAALAAGAPAISVLRNGLSLIFPSLPSSLPAALTNG